MIDITEKTNPKFDEVMKAEINAMQPGSFIQMNYDQLAHR